MVKINMLGHIKRLASVEDRLLIDKLLSIVYSQRVNGYSLCLPSRSLYVNLCGLIIGQRIRFSLARKRRGNLYKLMGGDKFTEYDMLSTSGEELVASIGSVSAQRIVNLTSMLVKENISMNDVTDEMLLSVDGVGPWTVKACKLMTSFIHFNLLLHEDKVVYRLLKECYPDMTKNKIIKHMEKFSPYQGEISWYLWRSVVYNKK